MRFLSSVLCFLFLLGVLVKGLTAVVQTQQTVVAAVGEEAHLTCQLTQSKDVRQVTWQKVLPEGKKTVAAYSKIFGQKVNPDFTDRVEIKDAGLQSSSIVIRELMEQDEGCYLCLFNCYPDGALTGRTCLQLYELHEPILHVRESDSAEESVVSCSATGRPAPTVTLTVTQPHLSHHNTVRVNNTNGTVTVTTTAELARFHDNSTEVGCAVRVLSVQKEVFLMIPELKQTSADGSDQKPGSDHRNYIGTSVAVVCVLIATVITITVWFKQNQKNRNIEMSEMNQPTIKERDMTQTPLVKQENNEIRKRTPPEKNQESDNSVASASATRKLNFGQC